MSDTELTILGTILLSVPVVLFFLWGDWRYSWLKRRRPSASIESYVQAFRNRGVPESLSLEAYKYLQEMVPISEFPVLPEDSIGKVLGIVDEDFDDMVRDLVKRCGCPPLPTDARWDRLRTEGDVVMFLHGLRQEGSATDAGDGDRRRTAAS